MELEGLTDNEKDARIAELEAKLAEAEKWIEDMHHDARERPWLSLAEFVNEFDAAREGE
jgi:uncharacterized coiled-coil protein SlyX